MTTLRRINQDDLRNHNLSVVISTLLRAAEPMSRAELAAQVRDLDSVGEHVHMHGRAEHVRGVVAVGQRVGDGLAQHQLRTHRRLWRL